MRQSDLKLALKHNNFTLKNLTVCMRPKGNCGDYYFIPIDPPSEVVGFVSSSSLPLLWNTGRNGVQARKIDGYLRLNRYGRGEIFNSSAKDIEKIRPFRKKGVIRKIEDGDTIKWINLLQNAIDEIDWIYYVIRKNPKMCDKSSATKNGNKISSLAN